MITSAGKRGPIIFSSKRKPSNDRAPERAAFHNKISALRRLNHELQQGLEELGEVETPRIDLEIDFYDAVSRFEIQLIKQALRLTKGHQRKAARILKLNATTLGSKIKYYQIQMGHPAFFK
jgi:DNA-binding NtrC family response regulator